MTSYDDDRDDNNDNMFMMGNIDANNDDDLAEENDASSAAAADVDDDDDDDAKASRYETSYSKLTALRNKENSLSKRVTSGNVGGNGGGGRRGYGGVVSTTNATNADGNDGDNDDNRNRLQEFDRLDLDADMFAMEDDANHNDAETGDLFLDGDDDDAASASDVAEEGAQSDARDDNSRDDDMAGEEEEEEFGSSDNDNDAEEKIVDGEFEAFRQSAASGRRRRQKQQHRSHQPSSPNATDAPTSSNNTHSSKNAHKDVEDITETTVSNDTTDTTTTTSISTDAKENHPPPPTKPELLQLVDNLFSNCSNTDTMTMGDINRSIAAHYGWEKVDKPRRVIIKERLTLLITGKVKLGAEGGKKKKKHKKYESEEEKEVDDDDDEEKAALRKEKKKRREKKREKLMKKKKSMMSPKKHSKRKEAVDDDEEKSDIGEDNSIDGAKHDGDENNESENTDVDHANSDGDVGNDSSSDYEEMKSSRSKTRGKKKATKNEKNNRRRSSSSGKMAKHLRDHQAKARRRQMEEARIRREELGHLADDDEDGDDEGDGSEEGAKKKKLLLTGDDTKDEAENESKVPKMSEEDRQRAQAIAARFDTTRDELRVKRIEDRVGLIDRLRTKRLELISASLSEDEEDRVTIANLAVKEEEEVERPKLTSTNAVTNTNATKNEADGGDEDNISSSNDDDDNDDEEESEDDLEIIAQPKPSTTSGCSSIMTSNTTTKRTSTVDLVFQQLGNHNNRSVIHPQKKASKPPANSRMALQNALRAKALNSGNRWLARELGYKDEEDHIRDCKEVEEKKRKQILLMEKEAALRDREREVALLRNTQMLDEDDDGFVGEMASEDAMKMIGANDETAAKEYDNEEDEEMAMARQLEQLEDGADGDEEYEEDNDEESAVDGSSEEVVSDETKSTVESFEEKMVEDENVTDADTTTKLEEDIVTSGSLIQSTAVTPSCSNAEEESSDMSPEEGAFDMNGVTSDFANDDDELVEVNDAPNVSRSSRESTHMDEEDALPDTDQNLYDHVDDTNLSNASTTAPEEQATSNKPKNSAWQAILLKEKAALAKEKRRQRKNGGLVEAEAEEEEEEEGIVGLEDFGFSVSKKKDDDEEDDGDVDQDDLDHVVDDVSDGEGDEEAGEVARKRLEQAEEKERHKEIIRRMREGYDGRRGGIASGVGGARGTLRFDQLVAADNRGDAKRLGLLNDDELNSDDEQDENKETKKDDEEEDEAALLDKMLKERFLNRDDDVYADENFTDDEESDDGADGKEQNDDEDDDDNREQDRLAKYFEKRARRNRILEEFEGDTQFSRSRLIDEDVSMQQDLKSMKTLFCRKRSAEGSNLDFKENNGVPKKQKKADSRDKGDDTTGKPATGLFLSVLATRRGTAGRKRTTTFVSGKEMKSNFSRSNSSSSGKSVALNHVVFVAGDNSQSASQMPDSTGNRVSFLGAVKSRGHSKVSKASKSVTKGSSLWSKVCSKNFR